MSTQGLAPWQGLKFYLAGCIPQLTRIVMSKKIIPPLQPDDYEQIHAFFERCADLIRERAADYEPPEISLGRIAVYWSEYLGAEVTPYDVAVMMCQLKIARLTKGHHQDSLEDAAAYLSIANMLKDGTK